MPHLSIHCFKMKKEYIFYPLAVVLVCALTLLTAEIFLRIFFGLPHGAFNCLLSAKNGLYPRNSTITMSYGFKPYTVRTNSWGMRGEGIAFKKEAGKKRIIALGDSVTDGFFVENNETYPYYLSKILNAGGYRCEVLSVAKGGGSRDKEYALLKAVMLLKPDIVILTFVNNDIAEIRGKSRQDLLDMKPWKDCNFIQEWFLTRTAIGELLADVKLRIRYRNYKLSDRTGKKDLAGISQAEKGKDFNRNVKIFGKAFAGAEGLVTREPFLQDTKGLIDNYIFALKSVKGFCDGNNAALILVYFPAYSQIYDPAASLEMRDILQDASKRMGIPFLDLTGTFRSAGKDKVLHFAPFDFHPNADGNRVIAEAVAGFVMKNFKN